ncbi:hypothetical protein AB0M47_02980 [Hamadaea sp. NPDC051192]|uniref:hypothetical protein n=1 Tax=Hamadaea sp. NPDC051192 TaxID=3154940 RepID=UPI003444863F
MNEQPLSPQAALDAVHSARAAGDPLNPPGWYAPMSLSLLVGGVAVAGLASFARNPVRMAGGILGIALFVAWIALTLYAVRTWRRQGYIPRDAQPAGLLASPRARQAVTIPLATAAVAALIAGLAGVGWALGVACLLSATAVALTGIRRASS